jgi:hypothetical protein
MDFGKVARFTNIADFDFTPELGAMYGGQPYFVAKGDSKILPYDLAAHLAQALAKQIFIKGDNSPRTYNQTDPTGGLGAPLWNEKALADLAATMLTEVVDTPVERTLSEAEQIAQKVEDLNTFNQVEDVPQAPATPDGYKDKKEVIEALQAKGISFDARKSKADLEQLLAA